MKHTPTLDELAAFVKTRKGCTVNWYNTHRPPVWVHAQLAVNAHGCNRETVSLGWIALMKKVKQVHEKNTVIIQA